MGRTDVSFKRSGVCLPGVHEAFRQADAATLVCTGRTDPLRLPREWSRQYSNPVL